MSPTNLVSRIAVIFKKRLSWMTDWQIKTSSILCFAPQVTVTSSLEPGHSQEQPGRRSGLPVGAGPQGLGQLWLPSPGAVTGSVITSEGGQDSDWHSGGYVCCELHLSIFIWKTNFYRGRRGGFLWFILQIATMARAELILSWEPGASSACAALLQGHKDLCISRP